MCSPQLYKISQTTECNHLWEITKFEFGTLWHCVNCEVSDLLGNND